MASRRWGRYLSPDWRGRPKLDAAKVKAAEKFDGKLVVITNDDTLSAEDVALAYKGGMIIESCFRRMKQTGLEVRPMFHWTPRRIEAHVKLCVLALQMQRTAEIRTGLPWARIAHLLGALKAVRYVAEGRTIVQRTKIARELADLLKKLGISNTKAAPGGHRGGRDPRLGIDTRPELSLRKSLTPPTVSRVCPVTANPGIGFVEPIHFLGQRAPHHHAGAGNAGPRGNLAGPANLRPLLTVSQNHQSANSGSLRNVSPWCCTEPSSNSSSGAITPIPGLASSVAASRSSQSGSAGTHRNSGTRCSGRAPAAARHCWRDRSRGFLGAARAGRAAFEPGMKRGPEPLGLGPPRRDHPKQR